MIRILTFPFRLVFFILSLPVKLVFFVLKMVLTLLWVVPKTLLRIVLFFPKTLFRSVRALGFVGLVALVAGLGVGYLIGSRKAGSPAV